ncbi:hypothetical protein NOCA2650004 [metagenome]|uniref:Uncharacterized protein n=1 Tax=metagenome TaxID=256318 RepID=A0A2P2CCD7_9ZZZZ
MGARTWGHWLRLFAWGLAAVLIVTGVLSLALRA